MINSFLTCYNHTHTCNKVFPLTDRQYLRIYMNYLTGGEENEVVDSFWLAKTIARHVLKAFPQTDRQYIHIYLNYLTGGEENEVVDSFMTCQKYSQACSKSVPTDRHTVYTDLYELFSKRGRKWSSRLFPDITQPFPGIFLKHSHRQTDNIYISILII